MLPKGYESAANLTDLAAKTGISRQSIYKHRSLGAPVVPIGGAIPVAPYLAWVKANFQANANEPRAEREAAAEPEAMPPPATNRGLDADSPDPVKRLGLPHTWTDEQKHQDVIGRQIDNEKRQTELDQLRGKLIPRERLIDALQELPPLVKAALERHVPDHCATLVATELAPDARKGARAPIAAILAEIAQGIERLAKGK